MRYPALSQLLSSSLVLGGLAAPPAAALSFSDLIVFGDSLLDAGNRKADTGVPIDGFGYFDGRFTNGIHAADVVNLAVEGTNSAHSIGGGDNYSYGGARAATNADAFPDLEAQGADYLGNVAGTADPNALYLLNGGGNDAVAIASDGLVGAARQAAIDDAASGGAAAIMNLQAAGATNILFVGVPDVGLIPQLLMIGAGAAGTAASQDLNTGIQGALPGGVSFFDSIALFSGVFADPAAFGLPAGINQTVACLTSGDMGPSGPPGCIDSVYFDSVHLTTELNQILGDALVVSVPEPGTGLLVAVLVLAGLGMRRRP